MDAGLITPGVIDDRSIQDIEPWELSGFTRVHFFAGLGGWDYSLRLAGWPVDRPVWTGSCPCQPFSVAGEGGGFSDPRHLWPWFAELISQCRPATIFGEQVAAASRWLDLVRGNLEEMVYAVGAIPIEAASAGADHYRDRYWFVADRIMADSEDNGRSDRNAGALQGRTERRRSQIEPERRRGYGSPWDNHWPLADSDSERSQIPLGQPGNTGAQQPTVAGNRLCDVVNDPGIGWGEGWTEHEFRSRGFTAAVASIDGCQYIECPDGKWRRLPPPRVRWLGNGIPARIPKLRAFGNAIDPRPASQFIRAFIKTEGQR